MLTAPSERPTLELLDLWLTATGNTYSEPLTLLRWRDFIVWSMIDIKKHLSLSTADDWVNEYGEFDCAYEDWKWKNKC